MAVWHYFTDPVLRAPTIASMLMCLSASLIGVLVFIRKRSLLGEALSHSAYPGVVCSVILVSFLFPFSEQWLSIGILIGAFISSLLGLFMIDGLEKRLRIKNDAALCVVLSLMFGLGILIASRIQITHALWYKQIQSFLFGQAATMTDIHILIYGLLTMATLLVMIFCFRFIELIHFDRELALSLKAPVRSIEGILFFLLVLAIVIGIRCVGVVLMSAMLITPAVAARPFVNKLSHFFILSAVIGMISGFMGNYFSSELPHWFWHSTASVSLPTGPMIVLSASFICLFSLLFSPQNGLFNHWMLQGRFIFRCKKENFLKLLWKQGHEASWSLAFIRHKTKMSWLLLTLLLMSLKMEGLLKKTEKQTYMLNEQGWLAASRLVRVHRLWEAYLVHMGQRAEKVHKSAEEMEHIITPELEKELLSLLNYPLLDPHRQPIPTPKENL